MNKQLIGLGIATLVFGGAVNSHAALWSTTFSATISNISTVAADAIWDVGDTVSFTTIFDNAANSYTVYNDGVNDLAEFGQGDDNIFGTFTNVSTSVDDADFSFDSHLNQYIAAITDINGGIDRNYAYIDSGMGGYPVTAEHVADGFLLMASWTYGGASGGHLYESNGSNWIQSVEFGSVGINSHPISEPVPEPATMLLFGTGLVGLVGSRFRKKKK